MELMLSAQALIPLTVWPLLSHLDTFSLCYISDTPSGLLSLEEIGQNPFTCVYTHIPAIWHCAYNMMNNKYQLIWRISEMIWHIPPPREFWEFSYFTVPHDSSTELLEFQGPGFKSMWPALGGQLGCSNILGLFWCVSTGNNMGLFI